MIRLFSIVFCFLNTVATATPNIAGVWFPSDQRISCACGHRFHLRISQTSDYVFALTEYCIGHKHAVPIGDVLLSGETVKLMSVGISLKFELSADRNTLTLIGQNNTGANPLTLTREDPKRFLLELSKIPATELALSRVSFLLGSNDPETPDPSNPFADHGSTPDAEQDGADQPATVPDSKPEGKKKIKPKSEGRSQ